MNRPLLVTITPELVALMQLEDCAAQLRAAEDQPIEVLLAAKSLHAGLVAALTAALAGSSGTGAYEPRLRERWRQFDFDLPAASCRAASPSLRLSIGSTRAARIARATCAASRALAKVTAGTGPRPISRVRPPIRKR